jgi:drug/metabolite transporter (DMT)-like permease
MKKAFLQLHIAVFLAGFTAILGKLIELNEGLLVLYRMLLSVMILGLIMFFQGKMTKIKWIDFLKITGVGLILAIHWLTFYGSIKYANASVGVVCLSASGFFSAIFEPLLLKKRFDIMNLFLGLMSVLGILIIFGFHPHFKVGIILGIISAIGSAIFPIFNKQLLQKHQAQTLTFYELLGGVILLSAVLPFYFMKYVPSYYTPNVTDLFWLVVLAGFCTVLTFNLQLNALKKISAFTSNLMYNLEPVYGVIFAFAILNEHQMFNEYFYLGIGLIFLAVFIQMRREKNSNEKAESKQ